MKSAPDSVFVQVSTGGDHLGLNREIPGSLHLAEIRGTARPHQGLQPPLLSGTHDLDLKIAAAGRTAEVISGPAGCQGARVGAVEYWKAPGRRRCTQGSDRGPAVLYNQEPVSTELARLVWRGVPPWRRALKSVRGAPDGGTIPVQVPAGDVKDRIDVELALILPDVGERNVLRVTDEPGCLMIQRCGALFEGADP
jgi:hypothetical protein